MLRQARSDAAAEYTMYTGKEVTMLLDLRRVFEGDDQRVPFVHQMDLSQIEQWGDRPFAEPVL